MSGPFIEACRAIQQCNDRVNRANLIGKCYQLLDTVIRQHLAESAATAALIALSQFCSQCSPTWARVAEERVARQTYSTVQDLFCRFGTHERALQVCVEFVKWMNASCAETSAPERPASHLVFSVPADVPAYLVSIRKQVIQGTLATLVDRYLSGNSHRHDVIPSGQSTPSSGGLESLTDDAASQVDVACRRAAVAHHLLSVESSAPGVFVVINEVFRIIVATMGDNHDRLIASDVDVRTVAHTIIHRLATRIRQTIEYVVPVVTSVAGYDVTQFEAIDESYDALSGGGPTPETPLANPLFANPGAAAQGGDMPTVLHVLRFYFAHLHKMLAAWDADSAAARHLLCTFRGIYHICYAPCYPYLAVADAAASTVTVLPHPTQAQLREAVEPILVSLIASVAAAGQPQLWLQALFEMCDPNEASPARQPLGSYFLVSAVVQAMTQVLARPADANTPAHRTMDMLAKLPVMAAEMLRHASKQFMTAAQRMTTLTVGALSSSTTASPLLSPLLVPVEDCARTLTDYLAALCSMPGGLTGVVVAELDLVTNHAHVCRHVGVQSWIRLCRMLEDTPFQTLSISAVLQVIHRAQCAKMRDRCSYALGRLLPHCGASVIADLQAVLLPPARSLLTSDFAIAPVLSLLSNLVPDGALARPAAFSAAVAALLCDLVLIALSTLETLLYVFQQSSTPLLSQHVDLWVALLATIDAAFSKLPEWQPPPVALDFEHVTTALQSSLEVCYNHRRLMDAMGATSRLLPRHIDAIASTIACAASVANEASLSIVKAHANSLRLICECVKVSQHENDASCCPPDFLAPNLCRYLGHVIDSTLCKAKQSELQANNKIIDMTAVASLMGEIIHLLCLRYQRMHWADLEQLLGTIVALMQRSAPQVAKEVLKAAKLPNEIKSSLQARLKGEWARFEK